MRRSLLLLALFCMPGSAFAARPSVEAATAGDSSTSTPERPLRVRVGVLAGLAMQKTDFELGAAYDFAPVLKRFRLVGDLAFGVRSTEMTLEPMVGLRLPISFRAAPKFDPYVQALAGLNLTFLRGSTALAVPFRFSFGGEYEVTRGVGLGAEWSFEVGPLMAPFAEVYAAVHVSVLVAWSL